MERDDLSPLVVPGGDKIGLRYRKLRPRAENTPLGARPLRERLGHWGGHTDTAPRSQMPEGHLVSVPPVSVVQRDTGPSGEWGYGARCLRWARAPSGSAT